MPWLEREYFARAYAWISGGTPTTEYTRRPALECVALGDSGSALTKHLIPDQLDGITGSDRTAPHDAGHLTSASDQGPQCSRVYVEQLATCRPVTGDLELRFTDTHTHPWRKLHNWHAFDGDVFAQDAGGHRHAQSRQLGHGFGVKNAHLP